FGIAETTDDTDSMYQVLMRRLRHLDEPDPSTGSGGEAGTDPVTTADAVSTAENGADAAELVVTERRRPRFSYPPQLLLVDGGVPQVEAAARALRDSGHEEIALCGIAKRLEEVWLPGED